MKKITIFLYASLMLSGFMLMASCRNAAKKTTVVDDTLIVDTLELRYAKGFRVRTLANGIRLVDVTDPQTDEDRMPVSYHFALIPKDSPLALPSRPERAGGESFYIPIQVPVDRTIVMTM